MRSDWFKHALLLALIGAALPLLTARAQQMPTVRCDEDRLDEAERKYEFGLFNETIQYLDPCLSAAEGFPVNEQKTRAYRLVALSHFALDEPDSSKDQIRSLLEVQRNFRASETDPQFFQYWVERLRPKRLWERRWVQVGGGALVVGALVYAFSQASQSTAGPDPPMPLPLPPGDPQ